MTRVERDARAYAALKRWYRAAFRAGETPSHASRCVLQKLDILLTRFSARHFPACTSNAWRKQYWIGYAQEFRG